MCSLKWHNIHTDFIRWLICNGKIVHFLWISFYQNWNHMEKCMLITKYILFLIFVSISDKFHVAQIYTSYPRRIYTIANKPLKYVFSYVNTKSRLGAQHKPTHLTYCNTTNNYLVYSYIVHPSKKLRYSSFVVFYYALVPIAIYPYLSRQHNFNGAIVRLPHYQKFVYDEIE